MTLLNDTFVCFEAEKIKTGTGMSNCRNQSTIVVSLGGLVWLGIALVRQRSRVQSPPEAPQNFLSLFQDIDLYEIVESYFKIMRKYGLAVHEEPYYWLSPDHRREIKYSGEMLKRTTMFDDNEIRISLLEVFE